MIIRSLSVAGLPQMHQILCADIIPCTVDPTVVFLDRLAFKALHDCAYVASSLLSYIFILSC